MRDLTKLSKEDKLEVIQINFYIYKSMFCLSVCLFC